MSKALVFSLTMLTTMVHAAPCTISSVGLAMVQHYEGYAKAAYKDMGNGRWTIGYGHQDTAREGQAWSKEVSTRVLREELQQLITKICAASKVKLTRNEATALASLAYNIGLTGLYNTELWTSLQAGKPCPTLFLQYKSIQGKVSTGLVRRRTFEAILFSTPDNMKLDVPALIGMIEESNSQQ